MKIKSALLLFTLLLFAGCSGKETPVPSMDMLLEYMTGSFSSAAQAAEDEDFLEIHLQMVQVWKDHEKGPWIYVEQAAVGFLDQPYRQRMYRLVQFSEGFIVSQVYLIPNALEFAGAWKDISRFDALTPQDLEFREGCSVYMLWDDEQNHFAGSTLRNNCASDLRGASYATSTAIITSDYLYTWDRGFDADGNQVWGSVSGGYRFDRIDVNLIQE